MNGTTRIAPSHGSGPFLASGSRGSLPVLAALLALAWSPAAAAQGFSRESVSSSGIEGDGHSGEAAFSADGRFLAFGSFAANLVPSDTNANSDVFLRDRLLGTTTLVSVSSSGVQGDNWSSSASLSANGRWIAFFSDASNLVANDTNLAGDVFVHDRQSGATTRVSVDTMGLEANDTSRFPTISADGRYVCFESDASNLVPTDTNGVTDIFVHDRNLGSTQRVSLSYTGVEGDSYSDHAVISGDGTRVVFTSIASNLVPLDTNSVSDVFLRDLGAGTTTRISVANGGSQGNNPSDQVDLSGDGRWAVFRSSATNLVAGDTNLSEDIFLRDLQNAVTIRLSLSSIGAQANGPSHEPSISDDGRWLAFRTGATNLQFGDFNLREDVYLKDVQTGNVLRMSAGHTGQEGNGDGFAPEISGDGLHVGFHSNSDNLVPLDTNGFFDVFVRDLVGTPPVPYCTSGMTSNGCQATMSSSGVPSATAASPFTLRVNAVEGQKLGIVFYSVTGRNSAPWGIGGTSFLCVKAPTQRTPAQNSGGTSGSCNGALSLGWNGFLASKPNALGNPFTPGQQVWAQGWFRDPPNVKTTSLSNGLEFTIAP